MSIILLFKLFIVLLFLIAFLRRPSLTWGVGLLTVSTAVLLDTIFGAFDSELLRAELGFFFYIIIGGLLGGMVFWVWALLRPYLPQNSPPETAPVAVVVADEGEVERETAVSLPRDAQAPAYDRQMLYEQIRDRFSRDDILDLMFDLSIKESDVVTVKQEMNDLIVKIMDTAQERGETAVLALAIERILTPPAADTLPRLEKINASSPPTILRHYLLAYYDLEQLRKMSASLGVDWESLANGSKKSKVRELLLYLYRRNQVDALVGLMQS